jgi:hypothetical protein
MLALVNPVVLVLGHQKIPKPLLITRALAFARLTSMGKMLHALRAIRWTEYLESLLSKHREMQKLKRRIVHVQPTIGDGTLLLPTVRKAQTVTENAQSVLLTLPQQADKQT